MRNSRAAAIVAFCTRRPWPVIALCVAAGLAGAIYAFGHFAINTDTEQLLSGDLPWVQRQLAYRQVFPPHQILAVVEAPTPELAEIAASRLVDALRRRTDLFLAVEEAQGGAFFERSTLLYPPIEQTTALATGLRRSQPALAVLAADPSLRGTMQALTLGTTAVADGKLAGAGLEQPMNRLSDMLDAVFAGRFASISWRGSLNAGPTDATAPGPARQFVEIDPKLDFSAVQPGHDATVAIRAAAQELHFADRYGASLRLTGRVPINDEQFGVLSTHAIPELLGTALMVLLILFLALRSLRIIAAVFVTLVVGFALTAALGLLLVGAFNLISISFAILFIGLGTDFSIQFAVRYRAERYEIGELGSALRSAAQKAGGPLALAAAGTAVGFFCFLPTAYRGVGELGEIAGAGMLIAYAMTMTLLPALLAVVKPPPEPRSMGFAWLAPVDRFLIRFRYPVIGATLIAVLAGTPLLARIGFDSEPIHLQNQDTEAVRTYRDLAAVPALGINAANVIAPSVDKIPSLASAAGKLPEVAATHSLLDLIPADQERKLAAIRQAGAALRPALSPPATQAAPTDAERVAAINEAATALQRLATAPPDAATAPPPIPGVGRLMPLLQRLAEAPPAMRDKAEAALVLPLQRNLDRLRNMLDPQPVGAQTLPPSLARDWLAPDGRARVEIMPQGDQENGAVLRRFAGAVLGLDPDAAGTPIELYWSERTAIGAFVKAGILAVAAVAVILLVALRRVGDVLLTLLPLLVAGLVTPELMVLLGLSFNFANVIALPLLLGVGVAFKIYYVMAWRRGRTNLLQSTLTRAVLFSALTTATAFGSLWLSNQPGMSSMGRLMALALACTLAAAVLFQPALMGPPRRPHREAPLPAPAPPAWVPYCEPEPEPRREPQGEPEPEREPEVVAASSQLRPR